MVRLHYRGRAHADALPHPGRRGTRDADDRANERRGRRAQSAGARARPEGAPPGHGPTDVAGFGSALGWALRALTLVARVARAHTRGARTPQLKQLRIKNTDGKVGIIEGLKLSTKVVDIKKTIAERKLFKPEEGFLAVDPKNPVCEVRALPRRASTTPVQTPNSGSRLVACAMVGLLASPQHACWRGVSDVVLRAGMPRGVQLVYSA
eukprot:2707262-Prymnesium_polylepis.1